MARKGKVGIDYFSHDVDMLQDKKIKIIKAKHGLIGYAVYLRLLEEIYRETGYYLHIDEDFNILFSDDNNISLDVYILILNDCIEKGLFDKKMYEKHKVLTSERIQLNYCSATERRKEVEFYKEYLMIKVNELYNIEKVNVNIIGLNVDIGTQSKVKKKKVDETKLKEKYIEFVFLTDDEHLKLVTEHGPSKVDAMIQNLNDYIGSTGKKYKSHYHTLLSWERKNNKDDKPSFDDSFKQNMESGVLADFLRED